MVKDKRQTVARWFSEYFTQGNTAVLDELTTDDFVYHGRNGDSDREKMKEFMVWYRSVFTEDEWSIDDTIEQEDRMAVRYTGQMTYRGGWFDIPSENQRVRETGIMIFKFDGSLVKELWCENSDAAILYELGALKKNAHRVF